MSVLPSMVVLGTLIVIAALLTVRRAWAVEDYGRTRRAIQIAAVTVLIQAGHFGEELLTGLRERLPALFGLDAMPLGLFVTFNVAWLAIWSISAWALRARYRVALFPLWFLGLGCITNGVAHPALAVAVGGYFPGLVTSPVAGVAGVMLLRQLLLITRTADPFLRTA